MSIEDESYPLHVFRFRVEFRRMALGGAEDTRIVNLCSGAFSECSGLEATLEPKVIKEGGLNYGAHQRAGPVTFGTVILKRGMTLTRDLWTWFQWVSADARYAFRLNVKIQMMHFPASRTGSAPSSGSASPATEQPAITFHLDRALPVRFKAADLNARGTEVGIEELHLAHEGLRIE